MKSNKGYLVWAGICFVTVVSLLYVYSYSPDTFVIGGVELKKIGGSNIDEEPYLDTLSIGTAAIVEQIPAPIDTIQETPKSSLDTAIAEEIISVTAPMVPDSVLSDSTRHRILLIGDSEAGGLKNVLNDYCRSNGHKLVATVEWYSATSMNFARGDTISKIIARYKPTYIFVLFGLNEVLARDFASRRALARIFQKRIRHIPYAWIGPTNWGQDFVVTDAFRAAADSAAFFSSKSLVLPKGEDGRHPSLNGYRIWMSYIANWIQTSARWKIKMMPPARVGYPRKYRTFVFNAAAVRGY